MTDRPETTGLAARIAKLEHDMQMLRDESQLYQLIATYAPAVDSGASAIVAGLWTDDGVYDVEVGTWTGHEEIAVMVEATLHQGLVKSGCAHVISMPHLRIDGDTAVATCHSRLYVKRETGFGVWRIAANRWEFVRTPAGWRISRRTNRLLDGSAEPRELLRQGIEHLGAALA